MLSAARLIGLGDAAAWRLVRTLPYGVARAAFNGAADIAARRGGPGTQRLRRNLSRVVPSADAAEMDELVRAAMRSYARYWMEAFRMPSMDLHACHASLDEQLCGRENLEDALACGKGAVVALPHSGNWDAAGVWLAHQHGSFTTVMERLKPESRYERFAAYRESLGFEVIPAKGGLNPAAIVAERLRANGVVCLLADRDLSASGISVTFFGAQTRMPAGPAYLAARTGAVLLPAGSWFTDGGWGTRIHPPVPVGDVRQIAAATQAMADVFAADIARHPADWHMMQSLWLEDILPTKRRRIVAGQSP